MGGLLKRWIAGTALALSALPVFAGNFAVVEIANFSCPHCRSMEAHHKPIQDAIEQAGGTFVFAPLSWDGQSHARDIVYYTAREQGAAVEAAVRQSLFRASQENGLPLEDFAQVISWLQQDLSTDLPLDWPALIKGTTDESVVNAAFRAAKLVQLSGVQAVPSFIFVRNGSVEVTFELGSDFDTPAALRAAVIKKAAEYKSTLEANK